MTKARLVFLAIVIAPAVPMAAQTSVVGLPELTVYSPRVALQEPVGTFAMPVSALRFEPLVDVQARNLAEAQADVVIRGGIFENTGFRVGAVSLYDPQTGHYFAEIPVAPIMMTAPEILTGAANAARSWNANAGTVAYDWRTIRTAGFASIGAGDDAAWRAQFYQGFVSDLRVGDRRVAFDVAAARSESDGSLRFSEHRFSRYNARVQLANETSQTDLFFGHQSKYFGWPNLYTPFANIFETENIQTDLAMLSHRSDLGGGDFVSMGGYYRRNEDHYVFNRPDAGSYNPAFGVGPSFHTTWVYGAGVESRLTQGAVHWKVSGHFVSDELKSSSLLFGRYHTRRHFKAAVVPERTWALAQGRTLTVEAGMAYDDTNHNSSSGSPIVQVTLARLAPEVGVDALYFSYAKSTQTPTYFALNSRSSGGLFRGNADLDREIAHNVELGLRGLRGAWTGSAAVFFRRDDRLVDWTYSSTLTNARAANAVDIDTLGFEAVVRFSTKRADVVFGYTGLGKKADYGIAVVDASFYALNFPRHRLTAAATLRLGGGWEIKSDNEVRRQEKNALRRNGDDAVLSSLGVYFSPPALRGLRFSVEAENLWDSDYQEVPAVPGARRQLGCGIGYAW